MKLEDFLKQGAVVKNPNYQKPTKKNPYGTPKYIKSNDYKDSFGVGYDVGQHLGLHSKGLTHLDVDKNKYEDYDVFINPVNTEEELKLERAKNQSVLEQWSNLGVQLGNEIVLGNVIALSDTIDAAIEKFNDKDNDYHNLVSDFLIKQQDNIRERFEIYQKNPEQNWAVFDTGWWANNMVSLGSSLSLVLPGVVAVKGLSLIGKLARLRNISKGIAKAANAAKVVKYPATFAKNLESAATTGINAFMSRTAENYLEARDVWDHNYKESLNKLKSMSSTEREKFFKLNPTFEGMSDEDIAKSIAGESADQTFKNDYAMLLFDIAQFKSLNSVWKGSINKKSTAGLRLANRQAIDKFTDVAEENITEITRFNKIKDGLKYAITNPRKSLAALELSEGVEEFYQGVQVEEGKVRGERFFDPTYSNKMSDYLLDGALWEQAFWGALGGIIFQQGGAFAKDKIDAITHKIKTRKLSDKESNLERLTEEKIREKEIEGRDAIISKYKEIMDVINNGEDPFNVEKDPLTGEPIVEYGEYVYELIKDKDGKSKEEQQQLYKQIVTDRFIKDLTEEAVNAGNFDLLKDFLSDTKVNAKLKKLGFNITESDINFENTLLDKMKKHADVYTKVLSDVVGNVDIDNEALAKLYARSITSNYSIIDEANNWIADIDTSLSKEQNYEKLNEFFEEQVLTKYVVDALNQLSAAETGVRKRKFIRPSKSNNDTEGISITEDAANEYKKDIDKRRKAYINMLLEHNPKFKAKYAKLDDKDKNNLLVLETTIKNFQDEISSETKSSHGGDKLKEADISKDVAVNLANKFNLLKDIAIANEQIPITRSDYEKGYEQYARSLDKRLVEKYNKAEDNVAKWLDKQEDLDSAKERIYKGEVPNELKESLSILKLGHHSTQEFADRLNLSVEAIEQKRKKDLENKLEQENTFFENGVAKKVKIEKREDSTTTPSIDDTIKSLQEEIGNNVSSSTGELSVQPTSAADVVKLVNERVDEGLEKNKVDPNQVVIEGDNDEVRLPKETMLKALYGAPLIRVANKNKDLFDSFETAESTPDILKEIIKLFKEEANIPEGTTAEFIEPFITAALKTINRRGDRSELVKHADAIISGLVGDDMYSATVLTDEELDEEVDKFFEAFTKEQGFNNKKKRAIIDFKLVLEYLKNNDNIGFVKAKYIIANMRHYVNSEQAKKKYVFINKKILNDIVKSPQSFIDSIIDSRSTVENLTDYMHISASSETTKHKEYDKVIRKLKPDDEITISKIGNSLSFTKDGVEIGYLSIVTPLDKTNTKYKLTTLNSGFHYDVTDDNGTYTSNTDYYFKAIIDPSSASKGDKEAAEELSKAIYDLKLYLLEVQEGTIEEDKNIENEYYKKIANNTLTQNLIDNGIFIIPKKSNGVKITQAHSIGEIVFNAVNGILSYESNPTTEQMIDSYNNWIASVYQNYKYTYSIQQKLTNKNTKLVASVKNLNNRTVAFAKEGAIDIKEIAQKEYIKTGSHKVVYVDINENIVSDKDDITYTNYTSMQPGSMGVFLEQHGNAPIIAWFTENNSVIGSPLEIQLKDELTNLLKGFLSKEITFKELHEKLRKLLGGPGYTTDNIFTGYDVILHDDKILLSIKDEPKKYALHIYDGKDTYDIINHMPDGTPRKVITYINTSENDVSKIVDNLMSRITFNRTFFALREKGKTEETIEGAYIQKNENNEIVITLGGKQNVYKDFLDFVLKNNAFKTNFAGWNYTDKGKSLYVDVASIKSPVEGKQSVTPLKELVRKKEFTKDKPIAIGDLINTLSLENIPLDILYGENGTIELLPRLVYYKDSRVGDAAYSRKENKIYLHKSALEQNNPKEILRILIHERLHQQFVNTGLDKREGVVTDLLDVYNVFINSINNDLATADKTSERYKLAERINNWLTINHFTVEEYGRLISKDKDPKEAEKKFNKNWASKSQEYKERVFAEEWLTESLTQKDIINYLNMTEYNGKEIIVEDIEFKKKSLWQKIIDALLKLFGINSKKIKNNSILAQEYRILGELTSEDTTPISSQIQEVTTEEQDTKTEEVAGIESEDDDFGEVPTDFNENELNPMGNITTENKPTIDSTEAEYDDVSFSATKDSYTEDETIIETYKEDTSVNPNGVRLIEDMNEFVNTFSPIDKPLIAKMIQNNEIKFSC